MANIMVLGDTHGSTDVAVTAVETAAAMNINTIIQCGDFGLWDHMKDGIDFLDELNGALIDNGIVLIWVDGNHENFDRLEWYCANNPKNQWGQVFIRSNILYSPRGCKFKMHDRMFMTVGGAVSIDKDWRIKQQGRRHTCWWPQEQLTDPELDIIVKRHEASPGHVDFLFTHDCPTNAPFRGRFKDDVESQIHRQRMDRLGRTVQPTMWFHGHMHTKYDGYLFPEYEPTTTVYGLECDGMRWNWGILNTETWDFNWGHKLHGAIRGSQESDWVYDEASSSYIVTKPAVVNGREGEWVEWKDEEWLAGYGYNDEPYDDILPD